MCGVFLEVRLNSVGAFEMLSALQTPWGRVTSKLVLWCWIPRVGFCHHRVARKTQIHLLMVLEVGSATGVAEPQAWGQRVGKEALLQEPRG